VRCGLALVAEVAALDAGTTEPPSTPDHAFDPSPPHQTLTGPVQAPEPKIPSPSSPKRGDGGPARDGLQRRAEQIEREELELFSDIETDKTPGASKQDPATRSADHLERRSIHPRKRKDRYRQPGSGNLSVMVLAEILAWSVYSRHRTPEPRPQVLKRFLPQYTLTTQILLMRQQSSVPQESGRAESSSSSSQGRPRQPFFQFDSF
jgi:hypothetical protein